MNYLLVQKSKLNELGIFTDAQELSDGRAVLSVNALKVLPSIEGVDIINDTQLNELVMSEKKKNEKSKK
jgi:hypothetical protein